jgi:hypothetical protein
MKLMLWERVIKDHLFYYLLLISNIMDMFDKESIIKRKKLKKS